MRIMYVGMHQYMATQAVEKVMNKLKSMGLKSAIISAGGNVKDIGSPLEKDKNKWGIGIQDPERTYAHRGDTCRPCAAEWL